MPTSNTTRDSARAQGALVVDERGARTMPTLRVDVVDTTGAGDCFDGALAVALAEDWPIDEAVRFAAHAAALACTRLGAQSAQPERAEVEATLSRQVAGGRWQLRR